MISVTILTKNSSQYLHQVLEALQSFPEVLIYDNGSNDNSCEIAKQFPNVTLVRGPFEGFGTTHNSASNAAKHDWILSIDSDEVIKAELSKEILELLLDKGAVYSFPRHNYYKGKWIRWCGWYPDRQIRLYNRTATRFTDDKVHERIISEGLKVVPLKAPLIHYSYRSSADFLAKMQSYSELFAQQNGGRKQSSLCKAVLHGLFAFVKSYLIKRGFLGGQQGFEISLYNANTAFYKYLKLQEINNQLAKTRNEKNS